MGVNGRIGCLFEVCLAQTLRHFGVYGIELHANLMKMGWPDGATISPHRHVCSAAIEKVDFSKGVLQICLHLLCHSSGAP